MQHRWIIRVVVRRCLFLRSTTRWTRTPALRAYGNGARGKPWRRDVRAARKPTPTHLALTDCKRSIVVVVDARSFVGDLIDWRFYAHLNLQPFLLSFRLRYR